MALEPITRQEQIIAGKDLEPITRMEKFLKEFGGGSGGGSAPSDWNAAEGEPGHVLNRTHYENGTEMKTLLDATITVASNQFQGKGVVPLTVGNTYTVTWDGTEYECVATEETYNTLPAVGVGNPYFGGGENNGKPFAFLSLPQYGTYGVAAMTNGSHTIKITEEVKAYKKLDDGYLPEKAIPYIFKVPDNIMVNNIFNRHFVLKDERLSTELANALWKGRQVVLEFVGNPFLADVGLYRQSVTSWRYVDGELSLVYPYFITFVDEKLTYEYAEITVTGGTWTPPTA
jgi:hypothetical protein